MLASFSEFWLIVSDGCLIAELFQEGMAAPVNQIRLSAPHFLTQAMEKSAGILYNGGRSVKTAGVIQW